VNLPHRDFFQYPPIIHENRDRNAIDLTALELDKPISDNDFTIFVSIPFCRVRCNSCPYFVSLLPKGETDTLLDHYVSLLKRNIDLYAQKTRFSGSRCKAVYFGGGTASILSHKQFADILNHLKKNLPFTSQTEITLEGNPHEFTADYLAAVKEAGCNRVSLGYQSSREDLLRDRLNSPHTADEGVSALKAALATGFRTVNVDLLYRVPGQTFEQWQADIEFVLGLNPQSVTTYEYVVHAKTVTDKRIRSGQFEAQIDREVARSWYMVMREKMFALGYEEPSYHTFAKPGHQQLYSYNSYEVGTELLGFGARSFSYVNGIHFAGPSTVAKYRAAVERGDFPAEMVSRRSTERNRMERHVIFRLRRRSTVDANVFHSVFGHSLFTVFDEEISFLSKTGAIQEDENGIKLTELGKQWRYNVLEMFYDETLK
jgi:oxygen-independent coproporphyrinogen III oxidase